MLEQPNMNQCSSGHTMEGGCRCQPGSRAFLSPHCQEPLSTWACHTPSRRGTTPACRWAHINKCLSHTSMSNPLPASSYQQRVAVLRHMLNQDPGTGCAAYLKSPQTFKLSWLPLSMYTAPPSLRACLSRSRSKRTMPAATTMQATRSLGFSPTPLSTPSLPGPPTRGTPKLSKQDHHQCQCSTAVQPFEV